MGTEKKYYYRQCRNGDCHFRFPSEADPDTQVRCPKCGYRTDVSIMIYADPSPRMRRSRQERLGFSVFLDNIRSAYNVGSIFRTADGAGISHLYLGGITPTPRMPKVSKTALGADEWISWSYHLNGPAKILELKDDGWVIWGLENNADSQPLVQMIQPSKDQSILLVVGNELTGVDPAILELCDHILSLPMLGNKQSLNVSVAFGIAVYWILLGGRKQSNIS
jgi:23S rRNA (guanosine2251-2'-O)-methyltransferase